MKITIYTSIATSILLSTLFTGCAASGGPGKSKEREYMTQGCIGGGIFAAVAATTLGSGKHAGKAAMFGCGAGAIIGYKIAKRTTQYVDTYKAIDSETQRNIDTINLVRNNNKKLSGRIAQYKTKLSRVKYSRINEQAKKQQLSALTKSLKQQLATSSENLTSLQQELTTTRGFYTKYKTSVAKKKAANYLSKISELEQERNILSQHVKSLNAMNATI